MKKLFVIGGMLLAASAAWATPACPTTTSSLASYIALGTGGCEIGDKVFSNFGYSGTELNSIAIPAASINVDTLGSTTGTDPAEFTNANIGLQFSGPWSVTSAGAGAKEDSLITFTVTVINGAGMAITDAAIAQTSSGASGAGSSANVTEGGCGTSSTCTPGDWNLFTFNSVGASTKTADDTMFTATGSVNVSKDIDVTAGTAAGATASMSEVQDTFSQSPTGVPEPATMALAGAALFGLGMIRRRKQA
jgi:hypothetical protein